MRYRVQPYWKCIIFPIIPRVRLLAGWMVCRLVCLLVFDFRIIIGAGIYTSMLLSEHFEFAIKLILVSEEKKVEGRSKN